MKAKVRLKDPHQTLNFPGDRKLSGPGNFVIEWGPEAIKAFNNGQIEIVKKYNSDEEADADKEEKAPETLLKETAVHEAPSIGPVVSHVVEEQKPTTAKSTGGKP